MAAVVLNAERRLLSVSPSVFLLRKMTTYKCLFNIAGPVNPDILKPRPANNVGLRGQSVADYLLVVLFRPHAPRQASIGTHGHLDCPLCVGTYISRPICLIVAQATIL